jgi:CYTH domain-containing protein
MSTAAGVDPLVAAKLGFPKLRYVFVELERRWSCTTLPKDLVQETVAITDLYVSGSNLRLREERSLSGGPPLLRLSRKVDVDASTRLISSIYLQESEFALLKGALQGNTLRKLRHRLAGPDEVTLAVDEFEGPLAGLMLLEAEFRSPDARERFRPPWFAGEEVTSNTHFTGGLLATQGRPDDRLDGARATRER